MTEIKQVLRGRIMRFPNVALSEIARPVTRPVSVLPGVSYRTIGVKWWGEGAYERETIDGSQTAAKTLSIVCEGDLIINKIWVRHGSTAIASKAVDGCAASGEFPTFELDRTKVLPRWIHWLTKSSDFWSKCDALSHGTSGKNRIKPEIFLTIKTPLPSLSEQYRIVARIEELAARIEEARGLRREAVEEADNFLSRSLSNAFKPHYDKMALIGDVFKVTTGSTPSRGNPLYWGGEIKWVSSGEVAFCRITDTFEKITELGLSNSSAKVYPPNTVLIAMIGQGKTRGQVAILDCYAATNQNVAGIHVYETVHVPEYVYWWLRSRYYESRLAETGTAQPALSGERVKQMLIPLPPPDEQLRIVKYLDAVQIKTVALKQLQSETSAELNALLPSILDKAFKGEL